MDKFELVDRTNSNVATNKTNITSIKNIITDLENNQSTSTQCKIIDSKLNEILKVLKKNEGLEGFVEDPFKIDNMPYTERIETNRNPNNYDFIEINNEFKTSKYFFIGAADCTGSTFDYNVTVTFTCETPVYLSFGISPGATGPHYEAGTHTHTRSGTGKSVSDSKIL